MGKNNNPRDLALNVINQVFNEEAYANIALNDALKQSNLTALDKSMATNIVYGTISHKMTLEWYLKPFIKKTKKWVKNLLLLSIYQIVYMDKVPDNAVVDEAVKIAKLQGDKRLSGFVNGVLRNFIRTERADFSQIKNETERLSIQYSMPTFLIKKFTNQYGKERTLAILESLETPSKNSLRVNTNLVDFDSEFDKLDSRFTVGKSKIASTAILADTGNFAVTDDFKNGLITIQDESSQLVAPAMEISENDKILDACAAPGGKTVHMAEYLKDGHITALDLYDHKLKLINDNAERLKLSDKISTEKVDASKAFEHFGGEVFDKALVDAPCSGMGLIRRKPDIKYRKETTDFQGLQEIQLSILENIGKTIKKNGIMVYSTCTIFDEENFQVVEKFLEQNEDFEQILITNEKEDIVKDGCMMLTPELYHTDGFFIAKFRKK
ncbi:16S rRNA (cytosine(967)-C(5))-methyltransferase RsmB [Floricoccus penangensis]|uniref:16S rRNA (cytosine(967)-C(5))-methyltransferase RsmB n=1 Tax=Floricoccus penangensis TaxID=1859475 RepID=UPI00203E6B3B|nr:16S rRNA (cytosine(967)-C(5))-methyltransferase RsmB [Floricoccus penangensis]